MISLPFWKSVGFNSLNFEGLTSTISCTSRLVNPYSATLFATAHRHLQEDLIIPHVGYVVSALLRANSFSFVSITHFTTL